MMREEPGTNPDDVMLPALEGESAAAQLKYRRSPSHATMPTYASQLEGHPGTVYSVYSSRSAILWARDLEEGRTPTPLDLSYLKSATNRAYRRAILLSLTPRNAQPHCAECGWLDHRSLTMAVGAGARKAETFKNSYLFWDWVLNHPGQYALMCRNCAYLAQRKWIDARFTVVASNREINLALGLDPGEVGDLGLVNEPYVEGHVPAAAERREMERRSIWLLNHPDELVSLKEHLKRRSDELFAGRLVAYALTGKDWGHVSPEILRAGRKMEKLIDRMAAKAGKEAEARMGAGSKVETEIGNEERTDAGS